jgi:hypothetical protein
MRKLFSFLLIAGAAVAQNVTVRPKMIDDLLVNPGMGIQTFQRFNNQAINAGLRWSEVGPEAKVEDTTGVNFPPSSVAYIRWFWSQLEPEQGKFRWDIIDTALDEARRHGQKLDIRMQPYDEKSPMPEWYQKSAARRANQDSDKDGKIWSPDSGDPFYVKHWGALVAEAGRRYDGHPYLDAVDISTFGYWGEGWGPYPPDWTTQQALTDQYFDAFKRTPLMMNFDVQKTLMYSTDRGAGWRADCWGDMGRPGRDGFAHMMDRYPEGVAKGHVADAWLHGPVSLESCGTPGSWFNGKYDVQYILDQALRWHVTTVNIKSTAIPETWKKQFDEFQKKMGYRFALRQLVYPKTVKTGRMLPVEMWWLNAGVAPVYADYTVALELQGPGGNTVMKVPVDIRKWIPGDAVYEGSLYVDDQLKPGTYKVRVGILDPLTGQPAIKLAIEGRQQDGWYDLGELQVQ